MAITNYQVRRNAGVTNVTVTSSLAGVIYYHWYLDGAWVASTRTNRRGFAIEDLDQVRLTVQDTNDPDYDPVANAPQGWPAKRTIWWLRSQNNRTVHYRVEQKIGAGAWAQITDMPRDKERWLYRFLSDRLTDLTDHEWRVTPLDNEEGSLGTIALDPEHIVRTPDAPNFTLTFNPATTKVTFAAA